MANEEQLSILKQGVEAWNVWRQENPLIKVDLLEADLHHANLEKANLRESRLLVADLRGANLAGADLYRADLRGASLDDAVITNANFYGAFLLSAVLCRANLSGAYIVEANLNSTDLRDVVFDSAELDDTNLTEANLTNASLILADLGGANLNSAILQGANLEQARAGLTNFGNVDLSTTRGLQEVTHKFASTIGMDTIQLSKGKIPITFLRGCGLSDIQIEMAKLATPGLDSEQIAEITSRINQLSVGGDAHYYSCFISYSSKDEEFGIRLHDDLQNNGVRCWFDREDLKIGDQIRPTIDRQIRLRDKLLVILSENSVRSEWVGDEVEGALEEESKSNRLVLFPIRLDDAVMSTRDDWAAKIKRRRHIGDFSNWKDKNSYQKAFERLLRDLKATGGEVNGE